MISLSSLIDSFIISLRSLNIDVMAVSEVLVLSSSYTVFLRTIVVGLLGSGGDILSWLLMSVFSLCCLGVWSSGD